MQREGGLFGDTDPVGFAPLDQFDGYAFDGDRITEAQERITLYIEQDVVWIFGVPCEPRVLSGSGDVIRVQAFGDWARCHPKFRRSSVSDLYPCLPGAVYN